MICRAGKLRIDRSDYSGSDGDPEFHISSSADRRSGTLRDRLLRGTCCGMRIGDTAGRRANPDFARQQDMFRRREVAFDPRAQRVPKGPAHVAHRLKDCRQGRGSRAHPGRGRRSSSAARCAPAWSARTPPCRRRSGRCHFGFEPGVCLAAFFRLGKIAPAP